MPGATATLATPWPVKNSPSSEAMKYSSSMMRMESMWERACTALILGAAAPGWSNLIRTGTSDGQGANERRAAQARLVGTDYRKSAEKDSGSLRRPETALRHCGQLSMRAPETTA